MNGMDELLAQAYGTHENIVRNQGAMEKTAETEMLEMLQKVAAAEGVDLNDLSDDDIAEVIAAAMGQEVEKTAEAEGEELTDADKVKLAEADYLGRTMAHSFYDELTQIQNTASGDLEKEASEEDFEAAALERANEIIAAYNETLGDVAEEAAEGVEKTSADDEAIDEWLTARAVELLQENEYDVDAIHAALAGE